MRDGRVDVYDSGCGVQNTVTIVTHRHGFVSEGHGNHYKRVLVRGVVRRQQGQHPFPPRRAHGTLQPTG